MLFLPRAGVAIILIISLAELVEKAQKTRAPEDLQAACRACEDALAAKPDDEAARGQKARVDELLGLDVLGGTNLETTDLDGGKAQLWNKDGAIVAIVSQGAHFSRAYRSRGKTLTFRAFGDERCLGPLDAATPEAVKKGIEAFASERKLVESTEKKIAQATGPDARQAIADAATALAAAWNADKKALGALEELTWAYDRLAEASAATPDEREYRRLEVVAARKLLDAAPDAPSAERAWGLACFRVGAYPLAAAACKKAPDDGLARSVLAALEAWGQDEHESAGSFEAAPGFQVELHRAKKAPPDAAVLFEEVTFVVTRKGRADFVLYTLSSQKLKTERHWYLHTQYLTTKTLLATYADTKPDLETVKTVVRDEVKKLAEKKPEPEAPR